MSLVPQGTLNANSEISWLMNVDLGGHSLHGCTLATHPILL